MITSSDSPRYRYFIKLKKKKERSSKDLFIVEGMHLVEEALKVGSIDRVIFCPALMRDAEGRMLLNDLVRADVPLDETSVTLLKGLSSVESPQGIIASVKARDTDMSSLFDSTLPLIVVACGIQDPGNLGTLIRTADAAGCSGVIVTNGTVDPFNEKVVRSTAGSIFHLNIVKYDDIIELVHSLKRRGIAVIATDAKSEKKYFDIDLKRPTAVIVGNEGQGLSEDIEKLCSESVSIPIIGKAESLNAAIAAALVLYEAVRQRMGNAR